MPTQEEYKKMNMGDIIGTLKSSSIYSSDVELDILEFVVYGRETDFEKIIKHLENANSPYKNPIGT